MFLLLDKYNLSSKVKQPKSQILIIISVSANQRRSLPCPDQSETELLTFSYGRGSAILGTCRIDNFNNDLVKNWLEKSMSDGFSELLAM